ncbi:MAG TPA: TadE/TadG family type IV pilus assembly protein [Sphingomicrobium sp.]|nr:TadE/TadG family type IV pilus assembly protein [Sphingomicrobium sp.]
MTRRTQLIRDTRGAGIIEFALILPALMLFVYGIYLVGQLFQANAGMQHALGEGARYATLCLNPNTAAGCTVPSDDQIRDHISSKVFGTGNGTFTVNAPTSGIGFKELSVTYEMPMDFLLFTAPNVSVTRTKKVYTAG